MKILGSQIGVFLFLFIGAVVVWIIDMIRKEKLSNDEEDHILSWFIWAGLAFAFICYMLYECSHPED